MAYKVSAERRVEWTPPGEQSPVVFHVRRFGLVEALKFNQGLRKIGRPEEGEDNIDAGYRAMIEASVARTTAWENIEVDVRGADGEVTATRDCTEDARRLVFSQHGDALLLVYEATGHAQALGLSRPNASGGGSSSAVATPGSPAGSSTGTPTSASAATSAATGGAGAPTS